MADTNEPNGQDSGMGRDRDAAGERMDERGERLHENLTGQPQHARKGQAQSPVQENHFEPPKHKEGHK